MKKLFSILYINAMGVACVYGAMLGLNKKASTIFCLGAIICFFVCLILAVNWGRNNADI